MQCTLQTDQLSFKKDHESIDSPLQIKLINFLGLKSYLLDKFVFKRKPTTYQIRQENNKSKVIYQGHQLKLEDYSIQVAILEYYKKNQYLPSKFQNHSIPVIRLKPNNKQLAYPDTFIYAHGNASDMMDSFKYIEKFSRTIMAQYIIFDYTAYGQSRKEVTGEQIICGDLQIVLAWATQTKPITSIILWGFSLGTFPVVYNAAKYNVKGTILQCPIASVSCFFKDSNQFFTDLKFKQDYFANIDYISQVNGKVFIMHSEHDQIIPFQHAKLLFDKYIKHNGEDNIFFIQIAKLSHNSLHKFIVSEKNNALKLQFLQFIYHILDDQTFGQRMYSRESSNKQTKKLKDIMDKIHQSQIEQQIFNEENYQLIQSSTKGKFTKSKNEKKSMCACFKDIL